MCTRSKESLQSSLWSVIRRTASTPDSAVAPSWVVVSLPCFVCRSPGGGSPEGWMAPLFKGARRENHLILPKTGDSKAILRFHCSWKKNSKWQQNWITRYLRGINDPAEEMWWEGGWGFDLCLSVFSHCQPRSTKIGSAKLSFIQDTRRRAKGFFSLLSCPGLIFCGYVYIGE